MEIQKLIVLIWGVEYKSIGDNSLATRRTIKSVEKKKDE